MEENNNSTAWKATIVVLLLVIVGVLTWNYFGESLKKHANDFDAPITSTMEKTPTVEEAMIIRANQLEAWRCESVYAEIPAQIMQAIYEKLGTQESIQTYVYEYELNEPYYISKYISQQAQINIDKNTAKKIGNIEVKTTLKEPESDSTNVTLTPGDSVQ